MANMIVTITLAIDTAMAIAALLFALSAAVALRSAAAAAREAAAEATLAMELASSWEAALVRCDAASRIYPPIGESGL